MKLHEQISSWILDYLKMNNLKTLVIGISGGIDSAVTSTLIVFFSNSFSPSEQPASMNKEKRMNERI